MISFGQLKTNVIKLLWEYSKNGEIVNSSAPSVADKYIALPLCIDLAFRKVASICGLDTSHIQIDALHSGNTEHALPNNFAKVTKLISPSGKKISCEVADGNICFYAGETGRYELFYKAFPESVAEKPDDFMINADMYIIDLVTYGAACELCEETDVEIYSRLKYRFDELLANRYNIDKLSTPPFNRVYGCCERRCTNVI